MNIINVLLPIIFLIFTGWALTRAEIFNATLEDILNKLVFDLSFPAVMFLSIIQNGLKNLLDFQFALAYLLSIVILFLFTFGIFIFQKKYQFADCIFMGMNASLSNSGLIAMPILLGIFGSMGGITSAAMLTLTSIFIFPLCILIIEHQVKHQDVSNTQVIISAIKRTILQPFILALIAASFLDLFAVKIPTPIVTYLGYLADLTIPCALLAIGIRLANNKLKTLRSDVIIISILCSLVKPTVALALALCLHLTRLYSVSLIVVSAAPVATTVFILSSKYNIYKEQTAAITFLTMLFSMVSMPFFLWIASRYWN